MHILQKDMKKDYFPSEGSKISQKESVPQVNTMSNNIQPANYQKMLYSTPTNSIPSNQQQNPFSLIAKPKLQNAFTQSFIPNPLPPTTQILSVNFMNKH